MRCKIVNCEYLDLLNSQTKVPNRFNSIMSKELEDLVGFLHSLQPAVFQIALDNLVGYSQGAHQRIFFCHNYKAIHDLKSLSKDSGKTTVTQSITILANLTDDSKVREIIVQDTDYMKYLVSAIVKPTNTNSDLMSILLANLAKCDLITSIFDIEIELEGDEKEVFKLRKAMDCLMDCFVKGFDRSLNNFANYDYLAYFFSDISRLKRGREYFVTKQSYDEVVPISKLLVFTEKYDSKVRREGVASTIKNSLFDVATHKKLVEDADINLLPYILLPLAGPEELDEDEMFNLPDELQLLPPEKMREPIETIVKTHLESLLLLSTSRNVREYLRSKAVYPLIRELHKVSDSEDVSALCDRLVQLLMRDEGGETSIEEDESDENDDKIIEVM